MGATTETKRFVFPRWANYLLPLIVVGAIGSALYVPVVVGLGASPKTLNVGYAPVQPIPYSHAMHAGQLGIDCRYCHVGVDKGAMATIPPTQTCMNCHATIRAKVRVKDPNNPANEIEVENPKLAPLFESWRNGTPVPWVRVHDLPDYAFFNHSAHVNRGVGCVQCHGRVDQMDVVQQTQPLSMSWCLDCHRNPGPNLRPVDQVTNMGWKAPAGDAGTKLAQSLTKQYHIRDANYMQACSTCHR